MLDQFMSALMHDSGIIVTLDDRMLALSTGTMQAETNVLFYMSD